MDPFFVRVLNSLVFTLGLGSLIGCLGYFWVLSGDERDEGGKDDSGDSSGDGERDS